MPCVLRLGRSLVENFLGFWTELSPSRLTSVCQEGVASLGQLVEATALLSPQEASVVGEGQTPRGLAGVLSKLGDGPSGNPC